MTAVHSKITKKRFLALALLLCACASSTIAPGSCEVKNFRTLQLLALKEMTAAVVAAQKADDIMIKEIDQVAVDLKSVLSKRMRSRTGREPLQLGQAESARLATRLTRLIAENPYAANPYYKDATTSEAGDAGELVDGNARELVRKANSSSTPANGVSNYGAPPVNGAPDGVSSSTRANGVPNGVSSPKHANGVQTNGQAPINGIISSSGNLPPNLITKISGSTASSAVAQVNGQSPSAGSKMSPNLSGSTSGAGFNTTSQHDATTQQDFPQQRHTPTTQSADTPPRNPTSPFKKLNESEFADSSSANSSQANHSMNSMIPGTISVNGFKPAPHAVRIKIISDPSLSFVHADQWRKKMPESWREDPGTISIVHNGYDSCLIWGAGLEGKPVFDRDKQRFKLVAIRLPAH